MENQTKKRCIICGCTEHFIFGYVPLPNPVVKVNQETLSSLTFKGTPILTK